MATVLLITVAFIAGFAMCYTRVSAYRRHIVLDILTSGIGLSSRGIRDRFKKRTGVRLALATVYADMLWLEERGRVFHWYTVGSAERGGNDVRIYKRTGKAG